MYKTILDGSLLFIKIVMMMTKDDLPHQLFEAHHCLKMFQLAKLTIVFIQTKFSCILSFWVFLFEHRVLILVATTNISLCLSCWLVEQIEAYFM